MEIVRSKHNSLSQSFNEAPTEAETRKDAVHRILMENLREFKHLCEKYDKEKRGTIGTDEVRRVLRQLKITLSKRTIEKFRRSSNGVDYMLLLKHYLGVNL